ncbi:MAG: transposase [Rhodanobacter sp.]|nr:transposase [Rhodanobacter sp.]
MTKAAGHQALRKGRVSLPGQVYLLTTVTADRTPYFLDPRLARATCRLMMEPRTWGDAQALCWVLMPDHWHDLIELGERDDLSLVMNRFKSLASKQHVQGMRNPITWARGFHDHALRHDGNIRAAADYIITNPVRAGLVEHVNDYSYWDCADL